MLIFNCEKIAKEKVSNKELNKKKINIDISEYYNLNYKIFYNNLKQSIIIQLAGYDLDNTVFDIILKYNESFSSELVDSTFDMAVSIILNDFLCLNLNRDREKRLSVDITGINATYNNWLKIVNMKTIINKFTIRLEYNNEYINLIEY